MYYNRTKRKLTYCFLLFGILLTLFFGVISMRSVNAFADSAEWVIPSSASGVTLTETNGETKLSVSKSGAKRWISTENKDLSSGVIINWDIVSQSTAWGSAITLVVNEVTLGTLVYGDSGRSFAFAPAHFASGTCLYSTVEGNGLGEHSFLIKTVGSQLYLELDGQHTLEVVGAAAVDKYGSTYDLVYEMPAGTFANMPVVFEFDATYQGTIYLRETQGLSSDNSLASLTVGDKQISLQNGLTEYGVEVPYGAKLPEVSAELNAKLARSKISYDEENKKAYVKVWAPNDELCVYTINYLYTTKDISAAELDYFAVNGNEVKAKKDVLSYEYMLPIGTTEIPEVTACALNGASVLVELPTVIPGDAKIAVTSENGVNQTVYIIHLCENAINHDFGVGPQTVEDAVITTDNVYDLSKGLSINFTISEWESTGDAWKNRISIIQNGFKFIEIGLNKAGAQKGAVLIVDNLLASGERQAVFLSSINPIGEHNIYLQLNEYDLIVNYNGIESVFDITVIEEFQPAQVNVMWYSIGSTVEFSAFTTEDASKGLVELALITANGVGIANFSKDVYEYELTVDSLENAPKIGARVAYGKATVTQDENGATILVESENGKESYTYKVTFKVKTFEGGGNYEVTTPTTTNDESIVVPVVVGVAAFVVITASAMVVFFLMKKKYR